jgi:asparagine synthase (glutamine-hydrolysing)
MCGICGVYGYQNQNPLRPEILSDMLGIIRHRGPDDEGVYLNGRLMMGMRRLSIIDLAGGKQPISNEDGSVVVVFNGEIYNYHELRDRLCAQGHVFATNSDTEVIVHLYEELGEECVNELRGMFAFSLWDQKRQSLFIARDRLGIKPLYYTDNRGCLIFGSEIKAILQHPSVEAQLDRQALSHFLSLRYVPAPQTMFAGIKALPPGYSMTCDKNSLKLRRYWHLSYVGGETHRLSEVEYTEQLEALLRESVKIHLMSDVPFGAFLSGGVDSSTIVALMSEILNKPVKTFSVGFDGDGEKFSELPFARLVAKQYETDHNELLITPRHFMDLAEKVVWHLDQPIADNACVANYMVSELAARQVKMVLTGEGGDELFAGYARYAGERAASWFRFLPKHMRSLALTMAGRLPGLRRPKLALFALCQEDELTRFTNWFPLFNRDMKQELLADSYKRELPDIYSESVFAEHLADTDAVDPLNRMLYVDTKLWLPDDLLARGDKTAMAVSLEGRVPLLDHKLVEFAASLPPNLKLKGLTRKYLLKKVARKLLPTEIVDRKKQGFPIPFSVWFRREARSFVRDLLSPAVMKRRGFYNTSFVERLLDEHEAGTADHQLLIWGLLSVELWHRVFLDSPRNSYATSNNITALQGN